jgi:hypothetical protein
MRRHLGRNFSFGKHSTEDTHFGVAALAPLVDLFTLLVVAILRSSSPEPALQMSDPNTELTVSTSEMSIQHSVVVEVGPEGIYVQNYRRASTEYWQNQEDILISELYNEMLLHSGKKTEIRIHAGLEWVVVEKILFTLQQAGIEDIDLLAYSSSSL